MPIKYKNKNKFHKVWGGRGGALHGISPLRTILLHDMLPKDKVNRRGSSCVAQKLNHVLSILTIPKSS